MSRVDKNLELSKKTTVLKRDLTKEDTLMAKEHINKNTLLIIREVQIKITKTYQHTQNRMATIQKTTTSYYW